MTWIRTTVLGALITSGLLLAACAGGGGDEGEAEGVVRAVDAVKAEVTIDHGEIPGMMKAMTMTFQVSDRAMLRDVAEGDRVEFRLRYADGQYLVTALSKR